MPRPYVKGRSKAYWLFYYQQKNAERRGIEFLFPFEEWVKWWEDKLGPDWMSKRGKRIGQYVMARFKDQGSYVSGNVECIQHGSNVREGQQGRRHPEYSGSKHRDAKLHEKDIPKIRELRAAGLSYRKIGKIYNINASGVEDIIKGKTWKHVPFEGLICRPAQS